MRTLTVTLRFAKRATDAIHDNRVISAGLTQTSTNTWNLHELENDPEGEFEYSVMNLMVSAGVPADEFEVE